LPLADLGFSMKCLC